MSLIKFYIDRDGEVSARESILMQFEVTLRALLNGQSHATTREFRPLFVEDAIAMCEFLGNDVASSVLLPVLQKVNEKSHKLSKEDAARTVPFIQQLNLAVDDTVLDGSYVIDEALKRIRSHPLDGPKSNGTQKRISILETDLERVTQLLQAEKISFSLS